MFRPLAALLVALLAVTAGCQGLTAGESIPEPVTPAPVPSATATAPTGPFDAQRLADRHRGSLSNRSYAILVRFTVRYENGTVGAMRDRIAVGDDGTYRWERRTTSAYPGRSRNRSVWYDGARSAVRRATDDGDLTVSTVDGSYLGDPTLSGFLGRLLGGFDVSVERTATGQQLSSTRGETGAVPHPPNVRDITDSSLRASVDGGVVSSLRIRGEGTNRRTGEPVTVWFELRTTAVGETDPAEPAWATKALANETETVVPRSEES
ncbi:hypothetical protein [Haloarcula nitratireducens]|uniref:Lipoprotein n=1 Tax=Haloarcula nitratireducens TaxID=2487749 RepID=A0AAW4PBL6_9EURY|nr:hypothetical protein [Halomicroarcula nitratireducens]MBX0295132.1 hypothetical protein [Halomicroarcula nitratireducens]